MVRLVQPEFRDLKAVLAILELLEFKDPQARLVSKGHKASQVLPAHKAHKD
jgi:hypothetical protein